MIDDDEDASGEGLMQRIGVDGPAREDRAEAEASFGGHGKNGQRIARRRRTPKIQAAKPWWSRLIRCREAGRIRPGFGCCIFRWRRCPLFGIGQHWIPAADVGGGGTFLPAPGVRGVGIGAAGDDEFFESAAILASAACRDAALDRRNVGRRRRGADCRRDAARDAHSPAQRGDRDVAPAMAGRLARRHVGVAHQLCFATAAKSKTIKKVSPADATDEQGIKSDQPQEGEQSSATGESDESKSGSGSKQGENELVRRIARKTARAQNSLAARPATHRVKSLRTVSNRLANREIEVSKRRQADNVRKANLPARERNKTSSASRPTASGRPACSRIRWNPFRACRRPSEDLLVCSS